MRVKPIIVTPTQIEKARDVDLFSYLNEHEPNELVRVSADIYTTVTFSSLKISASKGKWYHFRTKRGGHTALDFLVYMRGWNFQEAVLHLCNESAAHDYTASHASRPKQQPLPPPAPFSLPEPHENNKRIIAYLISRGIEPKLIYYCINNGLLYEDAKYHNCVFVGKNELEAPCNALLRSSGSRSTFLREWEGSNKFYPFRLTFAPDCNRVHVFESPIDLLSYITIMRTKTSDWHKENYLSLNGVHMQANNDRELKPPRALQQYLFDHIQVEGIVVCLDNDAAGRGCTELIQTLYGKNHTVISRLPESGKDYNEMLMNMKGGRAIATRGVEHMQR